MGFFDKVFKQAKRSFGDIFDFKIGKAILEGLAPDVPDIPPPEPPAPPIGIPETGGGEVTKKRRLILGGRGRTILAGQLTPTTRKKVLG